MRFFSCPLLLLLIQFHAVQPAKAYSVLTHEAIIHRSWKPEIQPLLLARFPDATEEHLRDARAHAYGGAILQDMGYYPFGNNFFTDPLHYTPTRTFLLSFTRDSLHP